MAYELFFSTVDDSFAISTFASVLESDVASKFDLASLAALLSILIGTVF